MKIADLKMADFFKGPSREQATDFGMALTMFCLVFLSCTNEKWVLYFAIAALAVNMAYPAVYGAVAAAWFNLSKVFANLVSKVVLALVFVVVVIPVGAVKRYRGVDPLNLKEWKKDQSSVLKVRDHVFVPEDMEGLY